MESILDTLNLDTCTLRALLFKLYILNYDYLSLFSILNITLFI